MSLSERIRPDCEAARWVVEEVKNLERENAELKAHLKQLHQISKEEYTCRVVCLRNSIDNYMEKVKL